MYLCGYPCALLFSFFSVGKVCSCREPCRDLAWQTAQHGSQLCALRHPKRSHHHLVTRIQRARLYGFIHRSGKPRVQQDCTGVLKDYFSGGCGVAEGLVISFIWWVVLLKDWLFFIWWIVLLSYKPRAWRCAEKQTTFFSSCFWEIRWKQCDLFRAYLFSQIDAIWSWSA